MSQSSLISSTRRTSVENSLIATISGISAIRAISFGVRSILVENGLLYAMIGSPTSATLAKWSTISSSLDL